ncbi:MAG: alpha/beta hydrolase [Lewinellaceae bacterium]|jgi:pimeloyl-ACP methyl ester carboxylesterase|nr:alpha/beta hydrolase [Lewinellaceae bacterium]
MKNLFFRLFLFLAFLPSLIAQENIQIGQNPSAGGFVNVNGIQLYYEIYGSGQPLLLLHGNGGSIRSRSAQIPEYAKHFKVIAVDSRCHGKSGCATSDLTYEQMAADVNALLNELKIDSCYIWGHSDGGIIALIMGYQYPKKVKKILASGANLQPDSTAIFPILVELVNMYPELPDTMMQKHFKLMADHPHIPFSALGAIKAPVLVMAGDRDAVRESHTLQIYQAIPNAQLCILPGTTHFVSSEKPALFNSLLLDFFKKPFDMPSTVKMMQQMASEMLPKH